MRVNYSRNFHSHLLIIIPHSLSITKSVKFLRMMSDMKDGKGTRWTVVGFSLMIRLNKNFFFLLVWREISLIIIRCGLGTGGRAVVICTLIFFFHLYIFCLSDGVAIQQSTLNRVICYIT